MSDFGEERPDVEEVVMEEEVAVEVEAPKGKMSVKKLSRALSSA